MRIITGFLISTIFSGFSLLGNSNANPIPAQSNFISVIANVQLSGAVKKPGIYKVPSGTRLVDVLVKAGGLRKDAVTANLNLTSPVTDGNTFYITSITENKIKAEVIKVENAAVSGQNLVFNKKERKPSRKKKVKKQSVSLKLININTATQEELDLLPGIGKGLAEKIIKYRTKNGRFKDLSSFNNVPGIGDKKIEKLKKKIII
jgi:competence protein ComEA